MNRFRSKAVDQARVSGVTPKSSDGATWSAATSNFAELMEAIDAATIIPRSEDDDGPRVFVMAPGLGNFIFDRDIARATIQRQFPNLAPGSINRAVRYLENRVVNRLRPPPEPGQLRNWVHGWKN